MKKSIITFIIGLLVGAIIATGGFYAYEKLSQNNILSESSMSQPPEMSNDGNSQQPPDKPDGDTYLTEFNDDDTTCSNIDFNGYTLYVNSKAIN